MLDIDSQNLFSQLSKKVGAKKKKLQFEYAIGISSPRFFLRTICQRKSY